MVLIFTDNEQLDRDLNKKIDDSRIVYYPDYVLEEKDALLLGIYDIVFDPFDLDEVCNKITNPNLFSNISKYIKQIQELEQ